MTENAATVRRYCTSPLAVMRKQAGMTQKQAAPLLDIKHVKQLCHYETGSVLPPLRVLRNMAVKYDRTQIEVLSAAVQAFETGRIMARHYSRKQKLLKHLAEARRSRQDAAAKCSVDIPAKGDDTAGTQPDAEQQPEG